MALHAINRVLVVLVSAAAVAGCSTTVTLPNGTEVPADEYRAQQAEAHNERVAETLMDKIESCPAEMTEKEASECRWSNALMMVVLPQTAKQLSANDGYWQYRAQRRNFWLQIATLALNNPFTQAFAYDVFGGGSSGGSVKITAKGESSIDNIDMTTGNKSPFVAGNEAVTGIGSSQADDDATAANREGHIVEDSQGVSQAQAQSDSFPGTNFDEGGEFAPNSSFGAEAGF